MLQSLSHLFKILNVLQNTTATRIVPGGRYFVAGSFLNSGVS